MVFKKSFLFFLSFFFLLLTSAPLHAAVTSQDNFFAKNYGAEWVSQTQANTTNQYFQVQPGQMLNIEAKFRNSGKNIWYRDGADAVTFAIYKDQQVWSAPLWTNFDNPTSSLFGQSYFQADSWRSEYRITGLVEEQVKPGEIGTFSMQFLIPQNTRSGLFREDISLAADRFWIANKTNGDPLGVAHIWVGFEAAENEEFEDEDEKINEAFIKTTSTLKKAAFTSNVNLEFSGDVEKLDLLQDQPTSESIQSLIFNLVKLGMSGKIDYRKQDIEASFALTIDLTMNSQKTTNTLTYDCIILSSEEKIFLRLHDWNLPFLQLIKEAPPQQEINAVLAILKEKWLEIPVEGEDLDNVFNQIQPMQEKLLELYEDHPLWRSLNVLPTETIDGQTCLGYQIGINFDSAPYYLETLIPLDDALLDEEEKNQISTAWETLPSYLKSFDLKIWFGKNDKIIRKQEFSLVIKLLDSAYVTVSTDQVLSQVKKSTITIAEPEDAVRIEDIVS